MLQRPQERAPLVPGRDADWSELMAGAQPAECVPGEATHPLYILYTSGTTGMPKGGVRDNGGGPGAPTWGKKKNFRGGARGGYLGPARPRGGWAEQRLGVPVIDHWWQTETGWPIAANGLGLGTLPVKPGSCARAVPGYDVRVLGPDGREVPAGQTGSIVIKLPLPPGCLPTLWNNDAGFVQSYLSAYPGYYLTADAGYKDADDYLWVMSRTDDIINVAGHRLSTGAMEEVLASHPDVAECAVVGVADALKGEVPLGFIVLKAGVRHAPEAVAHDLVAMVRERIGPVACFKTATVVPRLPKTRSGKVLRGTIKKIADGIEYRVPPTIDDPVILDEITAALATLGYPHR